MKKLSNREIGRRYEVGEAVLRYWAKKGWIKKRLNGIIDEDSLKAYLKKKQAKPPTPSPTCRVEAVVSVDDRGQIVLPKEIRKRAGIRTGDKLAVVGFEDKGDLCCISFFKVEDLTEMVKAKLKPVMKVVFQE